MIRDIQEALAALLEPGVDVIKVVADRPPSVWDVERLYVYPIRVVESQFETGPTRRQDFTIALVYITDDLGEGAALDLDEDLADTLDAKRGAYMAAIRQNYWPGAAVPRHPWEHLGPVTADTPDPRPIDKRSAAVRVSGWRLAGV